MGAMSGSEFLEYAAGFEEALAEMEAEYRNEVALYGDGPPGSAARLAELRGKLLKVRATAARIRERRAA